MVKNLFIICIILFLPLISCDIFFRTPFSDDLSFFKDSIDLTEEYGIKGPIYEANLTVFKDYLILSVREYNSNDKFFIFSKDLDDIILEDTGGMNSFIMEDASGNFIIGNNYYNSSFGSLGYPGGLDISYDNSYYGFAYNSSNYVLWFDRDNDRFFYRMYDEFWNTDYTQYDVRTGYRLDLLNAFYDDESGNQKIILFFRTDDWPHDLHIIQIPAEFFKTGLSSYGSYPFGLNSTIITNMDPYDCHPIKYITDEGPKDAYIIIEDNGRYLLYNETGEKMAEASSNVEESIEAYNYEYDYDGENVIAVNVDRYILSKHYLRLSKIEAWW